MALDPSFRGAGFAREPGIEPSTPRPWIPASQASPGLRNDGRIVIPIRRAGIVAAEFCKTPARAEVAAVFTRSFHLRSGDLFVCIGEPAVGNGPLTLIAEIGAAQRALRPGQPAIVAENRIAIAALTFACADCETWQPPPWPQAAAPGQLTLARNAVLRRATIESPAEGFGRALVEPTAADDGFSRMARRRLARLRSWLAASVAARNAPADPVRALIGLGPGLTPAGDDVLIGALALLDALGERRAYARLAGAISRVPAGLTSPLSHCLLRTAAAGYVGEGLHHAVSSLLRGDAERAIAAIRDIGHSSGWDMMAGILTALHALLARATPPCAADSRNR